MSLIWRERATGAFGRALAAIPPGSHALVMGTGIVSIAFSLDGQKTLSRILLAVAALGWLALALLGAGRLLRSPQRVTQQMHSPAALTSVAASAVLGTRLALSGFSWAAIALLSIAVAAWLIVLAPVLGHWITPTTGSSLLLTVSTESLAVLSAALSAREHTRWLLYAALVALLLGLGFYIFVISRFDIRELVAGRGDHWISGGALAISTLAACQITLAAMSLGALGAIRGSLKDGSLVLWALSLAWLPSLLVTEVLVPRLAYDMRRWATVFPVGMYAVCSFFVARVTDTPAISDLARIWTWIAAVVWLVVFASMTRSGLRFAGAARITG